MRHDPKEIIPDNEIKKVHANANFGGMDKREVVNQGVLKCASGFYQGSTSTQIIKEHGLIDNEYNLTPKGKMYLWADFCHDNNLFPPLERKNLYGFLYLFKYEDYYKIGHTLDVARRLKDISFYPPFSVEYVASVELQNPRKAEKYWHRYFNPYQIKGEWFLFENKEFMDMVMFMLAEGGDFDCGKIYSKEEQKETAATVRELVLLGEVTA